MYTVKKTKIKAPSFAKVYFCNNFRVNTSIDFPKQLEFSWRILLKKKQSLVMSANIFDKVKIF
jgi:hypothetical protein